MDLNVYLFTLINGLAGKSLVLDNVMIFLARYAIFIVPAFLIVLWFARGRDNKTRKIALFVFACALLSFFIGLIIGLFYFHPRPFAIGLGKLLISHAADSSFPSDHGLILFSVAFALMFLRKYKPGIVFLVLAFLVEFARIFAGLHFPLDIAGSFVISLFSAVILYLLKDKLEFLFSKILKVTNKLI